MVSEISTKRSWRNSQSRKERADKINRGKLQRGWSRHVKKTIAKNRRKEKNRRKQNQKNRKRRR